MVQEFGDVHRMFLQALLWKMYLPTQESQKIYNDLRSQQELEPEVLSMEVLSLLNAKLAPLDMSIKKAVEPATGNEFHVLTNLNGDEIAKLGTNLSAVEIQYFKKIMEMILESKHYELSSTDAINAASEVQKGLNKTAENIIDRLVQEGWLSVQRGRLSIGVRTRTELELHLTQNYAVVDCSVCNDIVLSRCESCPDTECTGIMHLWCKEKYFEQDGEVKCPVCQRTWQEDSSQKEELRRRKASNRI
ncbi:Nse1 non-SMC component of SMC5-6 complex-domain-containing protein [Gorgonomyces haynaldii]|nr:Nse1 non-SMC component of SMC5-6 complex-domain-containing protein [Gorgonomyces haynaldii]